jgi:hypothetical protein
MSPLISPPYVVSLIINGSLTTTDDSSSNVTLWFGFGVDAVDAGWDD